ncbi:unnamed protein product [Polarella glacialis]|uniref:Feruloyl esterase n=1 Tax=Polarella glacialis TaxID=89957 RepID=A0A813FIL3_POLGL|nr:unnamed protein product [Polarella glacialis]
MAVSRHLLAVLVRASLVAATQTPRRIRDEATFLQRIRPQPPGQQIPNAMEKETATQNDRGPKEFSNFPSKPNPANGSFTVWNFNLVFSDLSAYTRRFAVDVPGDMSSCSPQGCPILFDFPGSGGDVYSQRAWTTWFKYQAHVKSKFILVTMEGSPDAVADPGQILVGNAAMSDTELVGHVSDGSTSWNVLGWGDPTPVLSREGGCNTDSTATCTHHAMDPENSYQCWRTHLEKDPESCRSTSPEERAKYSTYPMIPTKCMSASGANDWDYVRKVVQFVTGSPECRSGAGTLSGSSWCGDETRMYFTGQSMGGMASIQFAAGDGKYALPARHRPAAVVASSAGGSRNNRASLHGQVPTLLMQGSNDHIAAPVVWAGFRRSPRKTLQALTVGEPFTSMRILGNASLLKHAERILGMNGPLPTRRKPSARVRFLLQADTAWGGALLAHEAARLSERGELGCADYRGVATSICESGYMWQSFQTTVSNVAGMSVDMSKLSYAAPASVAAAAADEITMRCATLDGVPSEIRVCVYDGHHSWPWKSYKSEAWRWISKRGRVFHDFVWMDFLQGGNVRQQRPSDR